MAINEEEEVYVVFSREQLLKNKKLYEKMGEVYPKTYVIINGKSEQYTDISFNSIRKHYGTDVIKRLELRRLIEKKGKEYVYIGNDTVIG